MRYSLSVENLRAILRNENVETLDRTELETILRAEPGLSDYKPETYYQVDPRTGDRIIYNAARARRPHDNKAALGAEPESEDLNEAPSIISQGKTTGVIDVAHLSEGFTFINMNLFPILYPTADNRPDAEEATDEALNGGRVHGAHFLQWTSSYQDRDWHNMPVADCAVAMSRLARLEKVLLGENGAGPAGKPAGYVSIIKNCGRLVGGSIAHGHQQIGYSSAVPRRNRDLVRFQTAQGRPYSGYLRKKTPDALCLKEYDTALLVVPYFMRRPYDMTLLVKDLSKQHLCELNEAERYDVAQGWQDGIRGMRAALAGLDRQIAFNITSNTGPGTGIFFDFLPYTQETGGFEHLGLWVCQGTPEAAADYLKDIVNITPNG